MNAEHSTSAVFDTHHALLYAVSANGVETLWDCSDYEKRDNGECAIYRDGHLIVILAPQDYAARFHFQPTIIRPAKERH